MDSPVFKDDIRVWNYTVSVEYRFFIIGSDSVCFQFAGLTSEMPDSSPEKFYYLHQCFFFFLNLT